MRHPAIRPLGVRTVWLSALVALLLSLTVLPVLAAPAHAAFPGANGRIAFERTEICGSPGEQPCGIWSMNPDGTSQTLLASPLSGPGVFSSNNSPAWSPDGQKIAFSQSFEDNVTD